MAEQHGAPPKTLGVFTLAMINVAAIVSLRNLPLMAEYGLASIFFYALAGIAFFIPLALVAAELATTWPETGGVYAWVTEAFGPKYGFLAVWMEWVENVVWFPTVLSFTAATVAYIIRPDLANDKLYMVTVMLAVFWGATFINFFGMRASGLISSVGSVAGTIVPGAVLILMAAWWLISGRPSQISFSPDQLIPALKLDNVVFFAGVILGYAGMEMAAFHAREAKNPSRDYPKAILLSTLIILGIFVMGSLAIAIVVPASKISLVAGLMQAMEGFFDPFGLKWAVPIIAFLTAIGALAQLSTWLVGPAKGLLATAKNGDLPPTFEKLNKAHMPVPILITQGLVGTFFILFFLFMPNASSFYWILTALTAQITVIMYILMFASAIRLRYSQSEKKRPYRVPGGIFGMWLVAGFGLCASVFTFAIGFVPPANMKTGSSTSFILFLVIGIVVLSAPPFILEKIKKPSWKRELEDD